MAPTRIAFVAIVLAGAIIAVVSWMVWGWATLGGNPGESDPARANPAQAEAPTPTEARVAGADPPPANPQVSDVPGDDLPLGYHCPNIGDTLAVHGRLSDECLRALERRYGEASPLADYIVPFKDPLTRNRVFWNPLEKRTAALSAVADETCRVPPGSIMPVLADRCSAGAMVQHALLLRVCNPDKLTAHVRGELRPGGLVEDLAVVATVTYQEDYWRRRREVEDDHYRAAYDYEKCSRVPDGIVDLAAWDLLSNGIAQESFAEWLTDAGKFPLRVSAEILMEFAARLGSEWALASYVRNEAHIKALRGINPVLATLHRGRFERWRQSSDYDAAWDEASSEEERQRLGAEYLDSEMQSRLAHLIAAGSLAAEQGLDFDLERRLSEWEPTPDELHRAQQRASELLSRPW